MNKKEKKILISSLILSLISGLFIFILKKWGAVEGTFGPESSPYLKYAQGVHYLVTPTLIYMVGVISHGHIIKFLNSPIKRKRLSGKANLGFIILLVISGQLLLFIGDKGAKELIEWSHLILGLSFSLTFMIHRPSKG